MESSDDDSLDLPDFSLTGRRGRGRYAAMHIPRMRRPRSDSVHSVLWALTDAGTLES